MNATLAMEDLRMSIPELVGTLAPGDGVLLTRDHLPVAKLVSEASATRRPRAPGNCKGMIVLRTEDTAHLEGFADALS